MAYPGPRSKKGSRPVRAARRSARRAPEAASSTLGSSGGAVATAPSASRAPVGEDLVVGAVQGVAPAAAAGGADADDLAGPDRLGVGQGVDGPLGRAAGVDHDLERPPGAAAGPPPASEQGAGGGRQQGRGRGST